MEDDEYDLQLALALSLEEQTPATDAAGNAAAQPAPASASVGNPQDLASILAAALQGAMQTQGAQPGQVPAWPSAQPGPALHPQPGAQLGTAEDHTTANASGDDMEEDWDDYGVLGPAPATHAAPAPAPQAVPASVQQTLPKWVSPVMDWWFENAQTSQNIAAELPEPELSGLLAHLGRAFTAEVAKSFTAAEGPGRKLVLPTTTNTSGAVSISSAAVDSFISAYLSRAAASVPKVRALQSALAALSTSATPPLGPGAGAAVGLVRARLALRVWQQLGDDEDDLYYETGQSTSEFISLLSVGGPSAAALVEAVSRCIRSADDVKAWRKVWEKCVAHVGTTRLDSAVDVEPRLIMLDALTQPAQAQLSVVSQLLREVELLARGGSAQWQKGGSLSPLFAVGAVPEVRRAAPGAPRGEEFSITSPASIVFAGLRGYPAAPQGELELGQRLVRGVLARLHDAAHALLKRLAVAKVGGSSSAPREAVVAWLAAAAAVNVDRITAGERGRALMPASNDNYALSLVAVALRFCRPFVSGFLEGQPKFRDVLTKHLSPDYYTRAAHRLPGLEKEATLAGEKGLARTTSGASASSSGANGAMAGSAVCGSGTLRDPLEGPDAPSFVADCFFITQRLMHVGLVPAYRRWQKLSESLQHSLQGPEEGDEGGGGAAARGRPPPPLSLSLLNDLYTSALLEPNMAVDAVQFAAFELMWLADLLSRGEVAAFRTIPEHTVVAASEWLRTIVALGQAEMLASLPIGGLMSALVLLLDSQSVVRSPLVLSKVVALMGAMLAPAVLDPRRPAAAAKLGRSHLSPGEAALVAAVLGTTAAQNELAGALMRLYAAADYVVGLDVDKDSYDKFSMRHAIDVILEEMWRDPKCASSITAQAEAELTQEGGGGGQGGVFAGYVSAVLNGLMYLFKDSLDRLQDIHKVEQSMADKQAWSALPVHERQDKERFYHGQKRTAGGFMYMARATLRILGLLTGDRAIVKTFLRPPLAGRAAYAVVNFLRLLTGPRCSELQVLHPERYHFDVPQLTAAICQLTANLAPHAAFVEALRNEPDFELQVLEETEKQLSAQHQYSLSEAFLPLIAALRCTSTPLAAKRQRVSEDNGPSSAAAAGPTAAAAAAALEDQLLVSFPGPELSGEALEEAYKAELGPLAVADFDSCAPGAYNSHFGALAQEAAGDTQQKMRRLAKEMRDLRGRTALPVYAAAAIFVRHDSERFDKVRALITGPQGTPYESGCFVFDVFFPPGYPNVPPLMVLETTGEGRARLNPNLYADGKVCLSLLGTWHGGAESEKWNPASSTLFQILLSIQGMIFIEDPYFNEPNVEVMRGKAEGDAMSGEYNAQVRLDTVRWAMVEQLRRPPAGLADAVRSHFRLLRQRVAATVKRWCADADAGADESLARRTRAAAQDLFALLAAL